MNESAVFAVASSAVIATVGLWWFRLILKGVRKLPQMTRLGVYALIWLAYFILTLILVSQ